jgi:hypothetical protein
MSSIDLVTDDFRLIKFQCWPREKSTMSRSSSGKRAGFDEENQVQSRHESQGVVYMRSYIIRLRTRWSDISPVVPHHQCWHNPSTIPRTPRIQPITCFNQRNPNPDKTAERGIFPLEETGKRRAVGRGLRKPRNVSLAGNGRERLTAEAPPFRVERAEAYQNIAS